MVGQLKCNRKISDGLQLSLGLLELFLQASGNSIIYTLYIVFSNTIAHRDPCCRSLIQSVACDVSPLSHAPFVFAYLKCQAPSVHLKPTEICDWPDAAINENMSEGNGVLTPMPSPPFLSKMWSNLSSSSPGFAAIPGKQLCFK